jgi:NADPH:quinone reductase-like Zn-dependent oxidoreductase
LQKAGLHVVGIAGASSDLAKSYGCDELIDYRDKSQDQLADEIKQSAGGSLRYAYDAISEKGSLQAIAEAFKEHGGQITYTLTYDDATINALPRGVTATRTLVATAHSSDADFAQHWYARAGEWLEKGHFRGMKVTLIEGGLAGVDEGLKRLQEGKVSGEKLVYRIADTPGLAA